MNWRFLGQMTIVPKKETQIEKWPKQKWSSNECTNVGLSLLIMTYVSYRVLYYLQKFILHSFHFSTSAFVLDVIEMDNFTEL